MKKLVILKEIVMLQFATIAIGTCVFTGTQLNAKETEKENLLNDVMSKSNEAYVEVVDSKKEELKKDFESGEITAKKYEKELKKISSPENEEIFDECATDEEKKALKDIENYELTLAATSCALTSSSLLGVVDTKFIMDEIARLQENEELER